MSIAHFYIPSPGQSDGAARAAALNANLAPAWMANEPRYASRITTVPCVVCDHGDDIVVIAEPTTLAAVNAAHDSMLDEHIPSTVPHTTAMTSAIDAAGTIAIAAHSAAVNPHNIGPATIGAAAAAHTHSYEPAGTVATHAAAADPHPTYLTSAEGTAAYSALAHNHDANYSATAHTHATPSAGAIRKTANQTMTLTAQTAVTDMSFAVAANATYYFVMTVNITTSSGTAPTTAWGFTGPAGVTAVGITSEQDVSTTQETKASLTAFGNLAAGAQVANTGAAFRGVIQNGGTAGTVQLTVARGGTTPSMVIVAGSNGYWIRVA
jgi:hypothetical protein